MDDNVIDFPTEYPDPNDVLEHSIDQFNSLLIVGYDTNGTLVLKSTTSVANSVLLLELAKTTLIEGLLASDDEYFVH